MRPRVLLRIVVAICAVAAIIASLVFALKSPHPDEVYKSFRAIT